MRLIWNWLFFDFGSMPLVERIVTVALFIVSVLWIAALLTGAVAVLTLPLYL